MTRALAEAISGGDLAGAVACFSRQARFMTPGETTVEGRDMIIGVLAQLIGMKVRIHVRPHRLAYVEDRALVAERWHISQPQVESRDFLEQTTRALSVHGRTDGGWKIIFLAPWGFD